MTGFLVFDYAARYAEAAAEMAGLDRRGPATSARVRRPRGIESFPDRC